MNQFRFEHPEYLYLLFILPALVVLYYISYRMKKKALQEYGEMSIISQLMPFASFNRPIYKFSILLLAFAFLIIAIAGPQFGSKLRKIKRKGVEIVIALDVSNSMLAQDIQPNRLESAKRAISKMVDNLNNDKIGLIVFAGEAYTQLPITTDYSSAKLFLSGINTDIVPVQGTAIGAAINLASKSFTPESEASKAIIVITDGENHEDDAVAAAKAALEQGIVVHTIAMGLPKGAPIPVKGKSGQFRQDENGNVVISKLDEKMLAEIAEAGGGNMIKANNTTTGLNALFKEINKMDKTELEQRIYSAYDEKFQYFIAIVLFLILIEYLILDRKNRHLKDIHLFSK
ncbi:VWA domain-containing protein [Ancylomarina salipaludis]|uniref:VWA domain-containing protein n=1 Tax=Ancylomarina salipaludis TaxID=2501299 RepID=A0A4Q1JMD7_9BACT|nr:VWA domain-containing protein [Ancylomarina salipaludis]RXQ95671.1 VWA domain-containing protein [Ancylomarina salipaludis]